MLIACSVTHLQIVGFSAGGTFLLIVIIAIVVWFVDTRAGLRHAYPWSRVVGGGVVAVCFVVVIRYALSLNVAILYSFLSPFRDQVN